MSCVVCEACVGLILSSGEAVVSSNPYTQTHHNVRQDNELVLYCTHPAMKLVCPFEYLSVHLSFSRKYTRAFGLVE